MSMRMPTTGCLRGRLTTVALLMGTILPLSAGSADIPDPRRGQALYENHCQFCHTPKVHSRPNKLALTRNELRGIVNHWQRQQNLAWTDSEIDDVVEYLNRTKYRFAPEQRELRSAVP